MPNHINKSINCFLPGIRVIDISDKLMLSKVLCLKKSYGRSHRDNIVGREFVMNASDLVLILAPYIVPWFLPVVISKHRARSKPWEFQDVASK